MFPNLNIGVFKAVSLAVSGLQTVPSSGLQSSESLIVEWTDTNTGTAAANGSFNDQIVITNTTTDQVLGTSLVYYNAAALGKLASARLPFERYSFALPYGSAAASAGSSSPSPPISTRMSPPARASRTGLPP